MKLAGLPPALRPAARRVPAVEGMPIRIRFQPELTAVGNGIESRSGRGREVYAASFPRRREMVLATELRRQPGELVRIFVHELFHFAWVRLNNSQRRSYEQVLDWEVGRRARGELGWSAELAKQRLKPADHLARTRCWREYACESFCDTAAWFLSGLRRHDEFTLAARFRDRRSVWFREYLSAGPVLL